MEKTIDFYCTVFQNRDNILVSGYSNGEKVFKYLPYEPFLYRETNKNTGVKSIYGQNLERICFNNISHFYSFLRQNNDISNMKFYGTESLKMQWISENFDDDIKADFSKFRKVFIDIETCCELGFPEPSLAPEPINAITYYDSILKKYYVLTDKEHGLINIDDEECILIQCENEKELLFKFVSIWASNYPDVLSGWNCLNENSNIWLKQKIIPLKMITEGDELEDSKVIKKSLENTKDEYLIKLSNGSSISCSKDHIFSCHVSDENKFLNINKIIWEDKTLENMVECINSNKCVFLMLKKHKNINNNLTYRQLFLNDISIISRYQLSDSNGETINNVNEYLLHNNYININFNNKNKYHLCLDDEIDNNLCQCIGLIYTDGSIDKKYNQITFYNKNLKLMKYIADILDNYKTGNSTKVENIKSFSNSINNKQCSWYNYKISKNNIFGLLLDYMILDDLKNKKINLSNMSLLSTEQFTSFFSGCVDGDGYVSKKSGIVSLCNYNNDIDNFYELLTWNGVFSYKSKNEIHIGKFNSNVQFLNKLNLILDYKNENLTKNLITYIKSNNTKQKSKQIKIKETENYYILRINNIQKTDNKVKMYDIETNTHYFYTQGIKTHNCSFFDIPYIINRIYKILGENYVKKLSPFGIVGERKIRTNRGEQQCYDIIGVSELDYLELYKKFSYGEKPSYSLKYITTLELGETKLDHEEFASMHLFYKENYQKFIEYNIQDVKLITKLDERLKYIKLAIQIAYIAKINFRECFSPVITWESLIYNYLKKQNLYCESTKKEHAGGEYMGAFVKQPVPNVYKWIVSFDLNSLYPSLIRQFNISPEKIYSEPERNMFLSDIKKIDEETYKKLLNPDLAMESIINKEINNSYFKENNISLSGSGYMFKKDSKGFLPSIMEHVYNQRKSIKKEMLMHESNVEKLKAEIHKRGLII